MNRNDLDGIRVALQAELVLFPSALERDSAFVAGQIDGLLNDPVATALYNKDGDRARIVRLAFKGNESMAMMVVLAAPGMELDWVEVSGPHRVVPLVGTPTTARLKAAIEEAIAGG